MEQASYGWKIEDNDDIPSNPTAQNNFYDIVEKRLSRRNFIKASFATMVTMNFMGCGEEPRLPPTPTSPPSTLSFPELMHGLDENFHVADGYQHQVLIRWGDEVTKDAPAFDPQKQSSEKQQQQFGYNNDFTAFMPLPKGSQNSDHGLLVVNHEYTNSEMMFPDSPSAKYLTKEQADIEIAAHGLSIIEIKKENNQWQVVKDSQYNRRITPQTPMFLNGEASGHKRLQTATSPQGKTTKGTYGNCAGGVTPWGTILTAEENIQNYFVGNIDNVVEKENHQRFGIAKRPYFYWAKHYPRWNIEKNPREPLHVGWVVEIDPYDPQSTPKKRTSLGRFKHEGCGVWLNKDKRIVVYSGDDQRFEYIYKFVSDATFDTQNLQNNADILDKGQLFVAKFENDGKLHWLPLTFGHGPLTAKNGFHSQADVMIDTRKAADLLQATPMDRPEDVEVNPKTGTVFAMLTNNSQRSASQINPANTRAYNIYGHIIEMHAPNNDHTSTEFTWDFFIMAGNPQKSAHRSKYHEKISQYGWFVCPDNCTFDNQGRMWVATDGGDKQGIADGVWACDVEGEGKALTKHFLRTPIGAELCGPFFTPDNTTFFAAVQHPGENSSFDSPSTRWPDFAPKTPPRPAVVAITKKDGGVIGT